VESDRNIAHFMGIENNKELPCSIDRMSLETGAIAKESQRQKVLAPRGVKDKRKHINSVMEQTYASELGGFA